MEVAIPGSNNNGTPFQREVREWQRLDPNTGALLTGRLEADRWINGSLNSYGKVVDSQNVSQPNGTQHSQRKQLEVLQARTSSGSMQVIRAHTVQTTSSRWTATSSSSASSSNSSSPALLTSLSAAASIGGGYFPSRLAGLTNETSSSADYSNGAATTTTKTTEDDHLTSNLHVNQQHAKLQQNLLSTAPSLKLSNLMKSTPSITNGTSSGSQNKAILHRIINTSNSSTAFNRSQQRHQFLSSSSSQSSARQQLQPNDSPIVATTALLQHHQPSTMSSTSTIAPTISSRQITTNSSGTFCYDSSRYDLPTIMTDTSYVGGSSGGRIIDICSRDLANDDDAEHNDNNDDVGVVDDNNDDRLRSSSKLSTLRSSLSLSSNRQSQRLETVWQPSSLTLQRGRSISTDDLSTNNVNSHGVGGVENGLPGSGGGNRDCGDEDYDEPAEWRRVSKIRRSFQFPSTTATEAFTSRSRPADLPVSSVSVSKIREELENGRRLSTAMRNNHLDLVALDNILNGSAGGGSGTSSPLTARRKTTSFLTAESLKEIRGKLKKLSDESLYKDDFVTKLEAEREDSPQKVAPNPSTDSSSFQYKPRSNGTIHTTNSLESRSVKYKDTSSAEWHLRRKSYGFEKMSPPDDKSMFRFENSTDSGLGRSSDLGNWSPTTDSGNSSSARATVITFGEQEARTSAESNVRPMVQRRLRNRTQPQSEAESAEMKRHSIAVDESQYVRENLRKTSAVNLNGFYSKDSSPLNSGFSDDNSRRQKRVEFCKTEVHFAAESGRVNIVETDGKPPPSNNFRRRRRSSSSSSTGSTTSTTSSSSLMESSKANLPVIHFGDERKTAYGSESQEHGEEVIDDKTNVTVSIPITLERNLETTSDNREADDHQDEISIRGILKNKPPKPKPYHLGENIESSDALWGVQLKPVAIRGLSGERDQTEEDFKEATVTSKSVAERVRIVEERKEGTGYSTKINLNLSNSPYEWTDSSELPQSNIMNIELHSPLTPTIKKPELIRIQAPVAKPRTSTAVKQTTTHKQSEIQQSHQHQVTSTKSINHVAPQMHPSDKDPNENLKIVKEARGARKLRDHELSYFGIKMESNDTTDTRSTRPKLTTNTSSSKRSLPSSRKLPAAAKIDERSPSANKWSLPSDKPDLLRHSPILVEPQVITKTAIVAPSIGKQRQRSKSPVYSSDEQTDGIYENIKQPYCRKKDLQRDEMILDEMTKTADQTMKAVSDEAAQKDLRRRSITRRSSKPLETIDEKFSKSISKTATRAKTTTVAHRIVRECSNRPSSASSGDSLPTTPIAQRSRSRSRNDTVDYANVKSKSISRPLKHRSSSGESRRSITSSTEDIAHNTHSRVGSKSIAKRSSTKDEPLLVRHHRSSHQSQHRSLRSSTESHDRHKVTPRSSTRDRVESHDPQHQHSSRSHRSTHANSGTAATKSDVKSSSSTTKSSRSRATSENDKQPSKSSAERVSRSKGHSSHSESRPHHRSLGSKTATMSSSGGHNSDTLIQSKNASRSTHSSSSKTTTTTPTKRSSKDRK